ncbi:MAG: J domain-containing protein [Treponema sp.]|jgi:DnaJ-domain-containing protein 1|nr:J domain-containing protein [Treponema sp.]
MGIFDRLGGVIKSYLNAEDERIFDRRFQSEDPDVNAAFDELNDYLNRGKGPNPRAERRAAPLPESVRADFAELGLPPGASGAECRDAYKKLLKIHHPDRHANHPGNFKKATEKTARINAAYDRIEEWRKEKT